MRSHRCPRAFAAMEWPTPAVCREQLEEARRIGFAYVEVGGWALDENVWRSSYAVKSVLFTYAWSQVIGGYLGLSMATHRNGSASILRRIGGFPLECDGQPIPPYYDPEYKCDMEVIRFDSRIPSPRYEEAIEEVKSQIAGMTVIRADNTSKPWHVSVDRLHTPIAGLIGLNA